MKKVVIRNPTTSPTHATSTRSPLKVLANSGPLITHPALALIVAENEIVIVKVVNDAVLATVTLDRVDTLVGIRSNVLIIRELVLSLKQRHGEAAGLEDVDDMLNDVRGCASILAARDIGLERGVRAYGFGGDMHGPVVGGLDTAVLGIGSGSRDDAVGRVAAGREQVGIDASIRVGRSRVDLREAAGVRDNCSQGMPLGGESLNSSGVETGLLVALLSRALPIKIA